MCIIYAVKNGILFKKGKNKNIISYDDLVILRYVRIFIYKKNKSLRLDIY